MDSVGNAQRFPGEARGCGKAVGRPEAGAHSAVHGLYMPEFGPRMVGRRGSYGKRGVQGGLRRCGYLGVLDSRLGGFCTETWAGQFQDHGMMNHPIDGCRRCHWIFENPVPLGKHQI